MRFHFVSYEVQVCPLIQETKRDRCFILLLLCVFFSVRNKRSHLSLDPGLKQSGVKVFLLLFFLLGSTCVFYCGEKRCCSRTTLQRRCFFTVYSSTRVVVTFYNQI